MAPRLISANILNLLGILREQPQVGGQSTELRGKEAGGAPCEFIE